MNPKTIDRLLKIIEIALILVVFMSLIGKYLLWDQADTIVLISLLTLCLFYFGSSVASLYGVVNFQRELDANRVKRVPYIVGPILVGLGLASILFGLLFYLALWEEIVPAGMFYFRIVFIVAGVILIAISKTEYLKNVLMRAIPVVLIAVFIQFVPKSDFVDLMYGDRYPAYTEAIQKALESGNKEDFQQAHEILQEIQSE